MSHKKKHTNDFGRDPIPGLVLRVSVPFMVAQFVNVFYSIADRIFIGNLPVDGQTALAGAGVCAPIVTLLSSFATLIGIGGSILFSMRLGQKNHSQAEQILGSCFSLLMGFSAALTILFLLLKSRLLWWFGASAETFPYADTYLTIYTCGTFFALLSAGMNYFITAQGFPALGMATTLIGAVLNLILDPVFLFGLDLGIAGAAIATVIAQIASCAFVLLILRRKSMPIPLHIPKTLAGHRTKCRLIWSLAVSDSCYRQHSADCVKCGASVSWRRTGRYADHLCDDRTELSDADHLTDDRHHGRQPAADQL